MSKFAHLNTSLSFPKKNLDLIITGFADFIQDISVDFYQLLETK